MKKKLLSCLLAAAITLSAASLGVSAATITDQSDPKTGETTITTQIAPTYTVTIPDKVSIVFNTTQTQFGTVELSKAQLEVGKSVYVQASAGALANTADNTKTIPYTLMAGENTFTGAEYIAAGQSTSLTLNISQDDWNRAYAGSYEGAVTFTVSYDDSSEVGA